MAARPPHDCPHVEAVLAWAEQLEHVSIDVRRQDRIYGRVLYRAGDPEGASRWVDEQPRDELRHAERLVAWLEGELARCGDTQPQVAPPVPVKTEGAT